MQRGVGVQLQEKVQGFKFSKHYVNVKDYESARKYLAAYLAVHGDYAAAHKLMGQIQEALERPYEAIRSYKCCLDLDENQKDVLLKICKIYADLPADRQAIKYWLEQAEDHFPGHSIVVKLKEMLTTAQGVPDVKDKEDLIRSEIMESPLDVEYRVKLLELLLDTGRVRDAFTHALQAEEDPQFNAEATYSLLWQRCVTNVTKAYYHDQTENELRVDELFLTTYLLRLDQLAILTLHNPNGSSLCALSGSGGTDPNKLGAKSTLEDAVSAVESLDILLNEAHKQLFLSSAWNFVLQHVTAQLYLHVATLLLKMPVKVSYDWQEAQCWAASLLERAYSAHPPCALSQEDWFLELDSEKRNLYHKVFLRAHHRLSVSGHILHVLCNAEDKSSWLADVKKEACSFEVRKRIYTGIFNGKGSTSWFLQDTSFVNSAAEFPSLAALHKHDQESQRLHAASLDHLVWLKLQWSSLQDKKCGETGQPFEVQVFEALPLEPPSFRSGAVETLSQVDVLAFLEATCYCASEALKRKAFRPGQGPLALPPHVGMQLCTGPQAHWWRAAYHTNARHALSKKVDLRCIMQRGLEVVRAIGNHGMDLILVVHLARTFSKKSSLSCADGLEEEAKAFENQAKHYWEAVLSKIESRCITLNPVMPSGRLFCVPRSYALNSMQELKQIQKEARMFLALNAMNAGCLDKAAKMFSGLTSARAAYYTALVMEKMAEHESPYQSAQYALQRKEQVALKLALERSCHESDWTLATRVSALLDDLQERMRHTSFTSGCSDDSDDELSSGGQNGFPPHLPYPKISSARWRRSSTPKPDESFYPRCTPPREFPAPEATPETPPPKQNADATADAPAFASQILELRLKSLLLHQELAMSQLQQMQEASQSMIKDQLDSHRHVLAEVKQQKTAVERIMKNVDEVAARTMLTTDAASRLQCQNEGSEQSIGRGSDRGYSRRKASASDRARLQSARGPLRASTPPSTPHMQSPAYGNYPMSYFGYPIAFLPWAQPLGFHFLLQPFLPSHGTTAITNVPVQSFYSMPGQVAHHVSHPPPSTSFASSAPSDSATGNVGQTLAFRHSAEPQTPAPAPGLASAFALATVLPPMQDYKESSMPAVSMHLDGAAVPAATLHTSQTFEFYVPANTTSVMSRRGGGELVTSIGPRTDTKGTSTVDSSSSSIATTVMTNELATSVGPRTDTKWTSAVDLPSPSSAATATATNVATSIEPRTDTKETSTVNLPLPSRVATAKAMQLATSVEPRTDTKETSTVDLPLLFRAATAKTMELSTSVEPRTNSKETSTVDSPLSSRSASTDMAVSLSSATFIGSKASIGLEIAKCEPPLPSSFEGSPPLSSSEKNSTEALPFDNAVTSAPSNMLSTARREPELHKQKSSTGLDTASSQLSQVAGSLPVFLCEKNAVKKSVRAADSLPSVSFRNDDSAGKLSCAKLEQQFPTQEVSIGSYTVTYQPPLHSSVTDSSPFLLVNGEKEAVSAADDSKTISSSNDEIGKLSTMQPEQELLSEKVLTGPGTAACQPPLTSPVTDSLSFFSTDKNGEEEAERATDGSTSISCSNDNVNASNLYSSRLKRELPREKVLTGPDTAACQAQVTSPVTDSLPVSSIENNGEKRSIAAKDGSTLILSSNDVGKLSSTQKKQILSREKSLTGLDTAACQPPVPSSVTDSSLFSVENNAEKKVMLCTDGLSSITSSNDCNDARNLTSTLLERELRRGKVLTGPDTAACQPPGPSSVTDSSLFSVEQNGEEKAIPATDGLRSNDGDDARNLSSTPPEPELPREKSLSGLNAAACQPPGPSSVADSSLFSVEKNGEEKAIPATGGLSSISSSNNGDDARNFSSTLPEQELPREKSLSGLDAAACQTSSNSPVTDFSLFSSIMKDTIEEVSAVGDSTLILTSNDDVGKIRTMFPEREPPREKLLTGRDTAACQPQVTSCVTDSLPISSVKKMGEKRSIAAENGSTSISSSNDVGKLSSMQKRRKLLREICTGPDTAACQPPLNSPVSDFSLFSLDGKNYIGKGVPAADRSISMSSHNDDVGKLSDTQPELECLIQKLTSLDTACQPPLASSITDSSACFTSEKDVIDEAVSVADDSTSISSSKNVGQLFSMQKKQKLPREKSMTGLDTAACQPAAISPGTDFFPFSVEKNGEEEAIPATNGFTTISSSNDDASNLFYTRLDGELPREKVLTSPDTAACQPPLTSPIADFSTFFPIAKNVMKEAVSAADCTTSMSSSDDVGKVSSMQSEEDHFREKLFTGLDTAACQSPLTNPITDSLPFVSVEEDDKKAADTSTWIKSSNDDVGKLSSTQLERELVRGKSLTDVYTAACQPPLTHVIDSLPFSIEKNGEKDAASTANGRTLISSSNDNHYDASILSREHPGNELPKEKVSTGSNTAMSQLPPNAASSFFSSGENSERNGTAKVISDNSEQASVSCKDDDHASELSSKHPEPEKPVFIFGVTLPNRKHSSAVATVHVEMPSEKDLSITCAICRGLNAKEVSGKFNKSSVCLSVGPHFEEETLELLLDEEIHGASRNSPRGRLSSEFSKALRYIAENKNVSTASDEGFCPSNFSPEVSAVTYSPEAQLPPSTSRPSTTTSGTHLVPATSSPMKTAPTLLTASESDYASSSPIGHMEDMPRRPEKASPHKRSHRRRSK